jgi:hypothetical protein
MTLRSATSCFSVLALNECEETVSRYGHSDTKTEAGLSPAHGYSPYCNTAGLSPAHGYSPYCNPADLSPAHGYSPYCNTEGLSPAHGYSPYCNTAAKATMSNILTKELNYKYVIKTKSLRRKIRIASKIGLVTALVSHRRGPGSIRRQIVWDL